MRLFGGRCTCCGERALAVASAGLGPGSPFGKSVEALVIYLHYAQAIGLERLRGVLQHYPLTLNQCERISCCRFNGF